MNESLQKLFERKRLARRELAARPIMEKLRMLEAMRERELEIRRAKLSKTNRPTR